MSEKTAGGVCPLDQGGRREDCAAWPACACEQKGADPASMRWPGIRNKLLPVQAMRMAGWSWPSLTFRNWYHGHWWNLRIGPWMIWGGIGTYD